MAATLGAPEAAAVIQNEALKVAKPELSANAAAKQKLAEVYKTQGAESALKDAQKALDAQKSAKVEDQFAQGLSAERQKQAVDGNIQGMTPEQDTKRNGVTDALQKHDEFSRTGFDGTAVDKIGIAKAVADRLEVTPWLNETIKGMPPLEATAFLESFVKDPQYAANFNRLLQERANHRITDADKTARLAELQKSNPSATWEDAAGQLEQEWQDSINNIPADAATDVMKQHLENAMSITEKDADEIDKKAQKLAEENNRQLTEEGKQKAKEIMEKLRQRWSEKNRGPFGIDDQRKLDFDAYAQGGLEAVFTRAGIDAADQTAILNNPDVRAAYESQFAESFINQRLRTGKLTKDNIYSIVDDPALGGDQAARVNKLQGMMESHKQLQDLIKKGQVDGTIQRGLWDKMKGLSPLKRRNAMLAILSLLALPLTAAAVTINHEMGN